MHVVDRAKNICVSPDSEWMVIAGETTALSALITNYVLPLAGLSAVGAFVGAVVSGLSIVGGLGVGVMSLISSVVGVVVVAFVIDAVAPTFGVPKSFDRASKVAAYSPTPVWVAGVLQILPYLGRLVGFLAAIYALYLLYLGLLRVMRAPQDKVVVYTVVVILCALIVGFVASYISVSMLGLGMRPLY
jgi:hypothetical protein